jgi:SAM-dependent methyltransferase
MDSVKKHISPEILRLEFGSESRIFHKIIHELQLLWERVKNDQYARLKFESWENRLRIVYGHTPKKDLFVTHTYLATLVKLILYFRLTSPVLTDKGKFLDVINGAFFNSYGLLNFVEDDFSTWIIDSEITDNSYKLFSELVEKLSRYDFSHIDEDFFKEIYEELIERGERHKAGEYYTPEWLSQLILREVFQFWSRDNKGLPKVLDPACGSGTFLCNIIHLFKSKLQQNVTLDVALNEILTHVVGIDINPLSCLLAKANYIIALGDLIKDGCKVNIPIYTMDALEPQRSFEQFDILVGNPPWLVMRSIKSKVYQDYLKKESVKYKLVDKMSAHLFTQLEMATLFFCKTADLYLKDGGIIGFVMPRSVIAGTIQHMWFRHFEKPRMKLLEILDLEVQPLFNMPSCVLIATKSEKTTYPVLAKKYSGVLPKKNTQLSEIENLLAVTSYWYFPPEFSIKRSYYFDKFKVGASIFPRTFYFIDIHSQIDNALKIQTSEEIIKMSKPPWNVKLEGETEPDFIYATLLAWEIIPFGYIKLRPVILPVQPIADGYIILDHEDLQKAGFRKAAEWFKKAEMIWEERRTGKSEERFPKLIDRLNYNGLLTVQQPRKRFIVLYNATGSNIVSCVIDRSSLPAFKFSNGEIKPKGFVVDVKSWFYETNDEMEAYYLSAILNSDIINALIKPLQPRGLFGARAIHRRPLLFQIPKFDPKQILHLQLSGIAKHCHMVLKHSILETIPNTNNLRRHIRKNLMNEITKINCITQQILEEHRRV